MIRKFLAPKGKVLFGAGSPCPGFIVLSKGSIRVTLTGPSGREVVLYRVGPGDVCLQTFTCLVEGSSYGAEGIAETDLEGEMIPADQFHARLEQDAAFRTHLLTSVAKRFGAYQELIEDVALTGFDARLAKVLLRLSDATRHVDATHTELATETASGRAYVTRRLAAFARDGLVAQAEDGIDILDPAGLQRIAAESR